MIVDVSSCSEPPEASRFSPAAAAEREAVERLRRDSTAPYKPTGKPAGGEPSDGTPPVSPLTAGQPLADLVRLANNSATPGVFAATLTAQRASKSMLPGASTEFWTYNGLVPGPLIDVFEGDTVRIRLENRLSQETTVHWHGLPVPPEQDGNPMDPVVPGATRLYEFTLPVGSAGTTGTPPSA